MGAGRGISMKAALNERYNELARKNRILGTQLKREYNYLLENNAEAKRLNDRGVMINNRLNQKLNESENLFVKKVEKDHDIEIAKFGDSLMESNAALKKIKSQFEALQKELKNLKEDSEEAGEDFDFSGFDLNDKKDKGDKEDKADAEDEEETEETEETEENEADDEISLASIIIEVTDVDTVIEELREFEIPEEAIKIVEKEDGEDEGKIKIDADYIDELGEYCSTKGWDLEEALGGKIVKSDDEDEEDGDDELAKLASMDPDDISDEDIFGPDTDETEDKE